jgi:hypothetical protein
MKAWETVSKDVPLTRERIEAEFRRLLGVAAQAMDRD